MQKIILIIMALLISGCSEFSLKRSASNKLVDFKGFEGSKRRPLYNKKYISRAKNNIRANDYDEDDYGDDSDDMDEISNPASSNRAMYRDMVIAEAKRKSQQSRLGMSNDRMGYPKLGDAKSIVNEGDTKSSQDLQREISELKKMMTETKRDLVKYRCPMGQNDDGIKPKPKSRSRDSNAHSISDSIGVE